MEIKLKSSYSMPIIGLGTWQLRGRECVETVKTAFQLGYRHFDTAVSYGNEDEIGEALKGIDRESVFLTSKVRPLDLAYKDVIASCKQSLERLKTNYLDLLLIHWPNDEIPINDTLSAFKKLIDQKKIRSFGVSNYTIERLNAELPFVKDTGLDVSVNQVEYHPGLNQEDLLDYCHDKGIALVAYSPLGRGDVLAESVLGKIGQKYSKTKVQVSLRWLTQKGIAAIPKSSSRQHLQENFDIFDFSLTDEEIEAIDDLGNGQRLINPELF
jgi:2,5-diketo-D-gluconate reductase B